LASLGAPNDPFRCNELFIREQDRGAKNHTSVLARVGLVAGLKHHANGIPTRRALMLVMKQHLACGQEDLLAIDLIQTQNRSSRWSCS
jgi:hypothetical protein